MSCFGKRAKTDLLFIQCASVQYLLGPTQLCIVELLVAGKHLFSQRCIIYWNICVPEMSVVVIVLASQSNNGNKFTILPTFLHIKSIYFFPLYIVRCIRVVGQASYHVIQQLARSRDEEGTFQCIFLCITLLFLVIRQGHKCYLSIHLSIPSPYFPRLPPSNFVFHTSDEKAAYFSVYVTLLIQTANRWDIINQELSSCGRILRLLLANQF